MKKKMVKTKKGFTIIEITITMAFVSSLLLTIAFVTLEMLSILQKGTTIKTVNSVGRGLVDDLTAAIRSAPSVDTRSLCSLGVNAENQTRCLGDGGEGNAYKYIFQEYRSSNDEKQYGGVFCTGKHSYLWNTYDGIKEGKTLSLKYLDLNGSQQIASPSENPSRLLRIEDSTYRACSAVVNQNYESTISDTSREIDMTHLANTGMENRVNPPIDGILEQNNVTLALYEFMIFPVSQDSVTYRTYMSATFTLGTARGEIDIARTGEYCKLNTEEDATSLFTLGSEFNYCALNKFNFAGRTAGS